MKGKKREKKKVFSIVEVEVFFLFFDNKRLISPSPLSLCLSLSFLFSSLSAHASTRIKNQK